MDPFLKAAIEEARASAAEGGIPVGSVLVRQGMILGRGRNRQLQNGSPVLHAELDALQNAGRLPAHIYQECTLYTTLSPCPMCAGAVLLYGIPRVVIGENVTFLGEEHLLVKRGVRLELAGSEECIDLMSEFIATSPGLWNEDVGEAG